MKSLVLPAAAIQGQILLEVDGQAVALPPEISTVQILNCHSSSDGGVSTNRPLRHPLLPSLPPLLSPSLARSPPSSLIHSPNPKNCHSRSDVYSPGLTSVRLHVSPNCAIQRIPTFEKTHPSLSFPRGSWACGVWAFPLGSGLEPRGPATLPTSALGRLGTTR